ncbi:MAG: sigma-70 family RNA polymerase sigma factor [Verrucomicrobiota bacterium]
MEENQPDEAVESYLKLLAETESSLAAYVHSLVNRRADAEDILQECKLVMWRQYAKFEPGTNFLAWARKIALHQILNYRRSEKRRSNSVVDRDFVEAIAAEIEKRSDDLERRSEALRFCLRKLPLVQRQAIVWRYFEDAEIGEIAEKSNRSEGATYRLLSRIRQTLSDCIDRTLATTAA